MDITREINNSNVNNIRNEINRKKGCDPYFATSPITTNVVTDYDNFPYKRYFRGVPSSYKPIVAEREAGWRKREDQCYNKQNIFTEISYPNHCFETACSTVYPCYPEYLAKYSDREALNVMLNKSCIIEYR